MRGSYLDVREPVELHTALIYASYYGHKNIVESLIKYGASIDLKNIWNWTALIAAVYADNCEIVDILIAAGADVNAQAKNGNSAL